MSGGRKRGRGRGMDRPIDRRDFLNGAAMTAAAISATLLADPSLAASAAPQDKPGYYPPALHGIRGSHPGSFDVAHSVRDGTFWSTAEGTTPTACDLVVVRRRHQRPVRGMHPPRGEPEREDPDPRQS